jgi:hypothetical protein
MHGLRVAAISSLGMHAAAHVRSCVVGILRCNACACIGMYCCTVLATTRAYLARGLRRHVACRVIALRSACGRFSMASCTSPCRCWLACTRLCVRCASCARVRMHDARRRVAGRTSCLPNLRATASIWHHPVDAGPSDADVRFWSWHMRFKSQHCRLRSVATVASVQVVVQQQANLCSKEGSIECEQEVGVPSG